MTRARSLKASDSGCRSAAVCPGCRRSGPSSRGRRCPPAAARAGPSASRRKRGFLSWVAVAKARAYGWPSSGLIWAMTAAVCRSSACTWAASRNAVTHVGAAVPDWCASAPVSITAPRSVALRLRLASMRAVPQFWAGANLCHAEVVADGVLCGLSKLSSRISAAAWVRSRNCLSCRDFAVTGGPRFGADGLPGP